MYNGKPKTLHIYPQSTILTSQPQPPQPNRLPLRNRKIFGILLFITQAIIITLYTFFLKVQVHSNQQQTQNYLFYQNISIMILIGFLLLRISIKNHSWSSISYAFFINGLIIQLYFLWEAFWQRVFRSQWGKMIEITENSFIKAEYAITAIVVSFGSVIGRVGPLQLLIMALIQVIGYSLNQIVVIQILKAFDAGGSMTIHAFAAFFGLTISIQLALHLSPKFSPRKHPYTNILSILGTLFLFIFFPSFNSGYYSTNPYEQSLMITNTIIALAGSCMGTFAISSLIKDKFSNQDILNATISGGVVIAASCGLFTDVVASLCVGLFAGVAVTICFTYLKGKLESCVGLYDVYGVFILHGLTGMFGGIFSAIAIAAYNGVPLTDPLQKSYLPFYTLCQTQRTFFQQGGIQIAGLFISIGVGIVFGLFAGCLMKICYGFKYSDEFYNDQIYFQIEQSDQYDKFNTTGYKNGYNTRASSALGSFQDSSMNISYNKMMVTEQ